MEAIVIDDIKNKMDFINSNSEFYKNVVDKCNRIKINYPKLLPIVTKLSVTGHFGEVVAAKFATEIYKIKEIEAGVVQGNYIKYAQEIGLVDKELNIIQNVSLNYRRRIDITMFEEDKTIHQFEAKAVSMVPNYDNNTFMIHVYNLKPDVPRLMLTVLNWICFPPKAVVIYIPDHTDLNYRKKDKKMLVIEADSYEKLIKKITKLRDDVVINEIDLDDEKYTSLITEIVKTSNLENNIDDVPINLNKSAVEKIIAEKFDLTLTGNVRSEYDALDKNGQKIEIKCGTIAPICDRHGVQAVLSKIKPDKHDELIACFHLPYEDKMIVIKGFKNMNEGSITFSGSSLKLIIAAIVTKSGGDKNKILTDIYNGLGDIDQIDKYMCQMIEEHKREDAVERHLHHATVATVKRKEKLANDPEKLEEYLKNKRDKAAERRQGLTAKVIREVNSTPVVVPDGKTEEEVRKEMLDRLKEEEMKRTRAKKAAAERERTAKKREEAAKNPPTEAELEAARAKKREYEKARLAKKAAEAAENPEIAEQLKQKRAERAARERERAAKKREEAKNAN